MERETERVKEMKWNRRFLKLFFENAFLKHNEKQTRRERERER